MQSLCFSLLILFCCTHTTECEEDIKELASTSPLPQESTVPHCPVWFFYNAISEQCECYDTIFNFKGPNHAYPNAIKCARQRAFIAYNYYVTHSKNEGLVFSYSFYYDANGLNKPVGEAGFIELPVNISELNDSMCQPANRKGILCSECIDGFGPSATSPRFKCTNCTIACAYSVVIYLLSQLVPVTIFYFIVLIFQINLTSSPMVCFIFYSQLVFIVANFTIGDPDQMKYQMFIVSIFHGVWNLDFVRYIIPPFCISPNLNILYIFYLQNVSTIFPFILILITWVCIKLHSYNYFIFVWMWRAINRIFKVVKKPTRTVIDTFATFFLLLYVKLAFVLLLSVFPFEVYYIDENTYTVSITLQTPLDPTVKYLSKSHIPQLILSILILLLAILLPVLLLAFYPVRSFRLLLFKCCSSRFMASLNIFVEKFYSCYRDGLDGGRDMRSFASLYFIITLVIYIMWRNAYQFYLLTVLFIVCSFLIIIVQPYKETYMAITDSLILANAAILSNTIDKIKFDGFSADSFYLVTLHVFVLLPMLWLVGFVISKVFKAQIKSLFNRARQNLPFCKALLNCGKRHEGNHPEIEVQQPDNFEGDLPDRMLCPEQYMQWGYDRIS